MSAPTTFAPRSTPERHRFTGEEVMTMMRAGLLLEGGKFELMDGEIIEMPSEGGPHLELKRALNKFLIKALPDEIALVPDGTLRLDEHYWPDPDFYLYPADLRAEDARGPDVLLVIEISDTTLKFDLRDKAGAYRKHGVREYWVLDVNKRESHVHLLGAVDAWPKKPIRFEDPLKPTLLPGLTVRLADLAP